MVSSLPHKFPILGTDLFPRTSTNKFPIFQHAVHPRPLALCIGTPIENPFFANRHAMNNKNKRSNLHGTVTRSRLCLKTGGTAAHELFLGVCTDPSRIVVFVFIVDLQIEIEISNSMNMKSNTEHVIFRRGVGPESGGIHCASCVQRSRRDFWLRKFVPKF